MYATHMKIRDENKNAIIKLSVIIPVFNVAPYLPMCMDSLLSTQSDAVEYICVAGKSHDNSTEILRRYAAQDWRITILEQQDTGLSEARNLGVSKAAGEYIMFADSDDFVKPSLFQSLFKAIEENPQEDVFVTDFSMVMVQNKEIREKPIYQIGEENDGAEGLDFLPKMLKKRQCFWNVWRYVFRRSFLENHSISFRSGTMCEDLDFTNQVLMSEPKMLFLHCPFYCYRIARKDSLMGHTTSQRIRDTVSVLDNSIRSLQHSDFKWKQNLIEQYQFELFLSMAQIYEVPIEEREIVKNMFQNTLSALNVGTDWVAKTAYHICTIIGIGAVARCLSGAKKIKRKGREAWKISEELVC